MRWHIGSWQSVTGDRGSPVLLSLARSCVVVVVVVAVSWSVVLPRGVHIGASRARSHHAGLENVLNIRPIMENKTNPS